MLDLPRQIAALVLAAACGTAAAQAPAFAVVDGAVITAAEFEAALQNTVRQKHYHREVPEAKMREFQREVAQNLIERSLLVTEARRRGLAADAARIDATVAKYDERYAGNAAWREQRETLVASLRRELEERDLVAQLRSAAEAGAPAEEEARAYYDAHPDAFVEPAQWRISASTLKVDPAAPQAAWQAAEAEARAARARILQSGDFSELADRGTFHDGVLPPAIAERLAAMSPGELSEPIRVLEGVALVRLTERKDARKQPFEVARARAAQLWQREQDAQRWTAFVERLRGAATIRVDLARYPALGGIAP